MSVLHWDRPPRRLSLQQWRARRHPVPGGYLPNMSDADRSKWKARLIGGKDPRVEIRKGSGRALLLIVVRNREGRLSNVPGTPLPRGVRFSANGTVELDNLEWIELTQAVQEARLALDTRSPQLELSHG